MQNDVWRLTIEKENGQCVSIHGPEIALREAYEDWISWEGRYAEEWEQNEEIGRNTADAREFKVQTIHGFANDATRSYDSIAYRWHDVIGMCLQEIA